MILRVLMMIFVFVLQINLCRGSITNIPMILKQDTGYTINLQYQKKPIVLTAQLSNEKSWIKKSDCKICETKDQCSESCLEDNQDGIKCTAKNCEIQEESQEQGSIISGKLAKIKFKYPKEKVLIQMSMIMAAKMDKNIEGVGRINLFQNSVLGTNNILLAKDPKTTNINIYYGQDELQSSIKKLPGEITINSEQQDTNIFEASQLKLLDERNHRQDPIQIPLHKINAELSFETSLLQLPERIFMKFTTQLLDNYFKDQKCEITKKKEIICKKKVKLEKLEGVIVQLLLNGVEVQFPLRVLFTTCQQKKCEILLGVSKHKKIIMIGDFIFDVFGIEHHSAENTFQLYRLDNKWGQDFSENKKIKAKNTNFIVILITLVFKALWMIFKIIFYLAAISLILNCIYHRNEVIGWFIQIVQKLREQKEKGKQKLSKLAKIREKAKVISSISEQIDSDSDQLSS